MPADDPTSALSELSKWSEFAELTGSGLTGLSGLSEVPGGNAPARRPAGTVTWFYGPMDCGKSTLALQLDHNFAAQGRRGLLLTRLDRSGEARITSRLGVSKPAVDVGDAPVVWLVLDSVPLDYVLVDEAQFFSESQVEELCELADTMRLDVYAFGIATDFRGRLFPGSARWFELADEAALLQVKALCWCGRPGRFNSRVVDGEVARTGDTVVVADVRGVSIDSPQVHYQVLCRMHHRSGALAPST